MICSFALDTAAILGGDEYLIQQILEELQKLQYNRNEKNVLRWALTEVRINVNYKIFPPMFFISIQRIKTAMITFYFHVNTISYGETLQHKNCLKTVIHKIPMKNILVKKEGQRIKHV